MVDNAPFLQIRYAGTINSPAVYATYPDGRLELIGNPDFDTAVTVNAYESRRNQVIEFEGDLYVNHNGRIWILNQATNTWQLDTGAATTSRPANLQYGFYVVNVTGVPHLFAMQSSSAAINTAFRVKVSPNFGGTTWTEAIESLSLSDNGTDSVYFDNLIFKNNFYQQFSDAQNSLSQVVKFNFELRDWSVVNHNLPPTAAVGSGSSIYGPATFCAYNDKLYELLFAGDNDNTSVPQSIYLQEVEGGGAFGSTHALTIASGLTSVTNTSDTTTADRNYGRTTMFVDTNEDKMYAMCIVQSGQGFTDGWACFEIEESGGQLRVLRDVGQNVLPEQIAFSKAQVSRPMSERMRHYTTVDESGMEVIYVEYEPLDTPFTSAAPNSATNFYRWRGPDTPMEFLGFQPAGLWSKPRPQQGEGNHIFSSRIPFNFGFSVEPSGAIATLPGTMRLKTRVYGSGQPIELYFLFNKEGETNLQRADVFSSSSGVPDEANKRITQVRAEGTEIVCQWRAQSDGVGLDEKFTIMPVASVTGVA